MQLEAGKKYTDRRGRIYGPMITADAGGSLFGESPNDYGWYRSGQRSPGKPMQGDLVAEYVEPVQPEYRMLQDGEIVQPGDEYCGWCGKWEKVPSTGYVFKSSLYHQHRRLVKAVPPKARTVVLKEWLCWDDCGPVVLLWQDVDPTTDGIAYNEFDHAHTTGNTRTVEIPVT